MLLNKLNPHRKSESGNVFAIILLGVFLLGALMYMFQRSANQGTGNISKQQASIASQEILNYARLVEGAVDRVRRNSCSESEISFENTTVAGYTNPNSPIDESCHIFSDNGGKITYSPIQKIWLDSNGETDPIYGEYTFVGDSSVDNVISTRSELIFYAPHLRKEICIKINDSLGIDPIAGQPPEDNTGMVTSGKFIGSFVPSPSAAGRIGDSGSSSTISLEQAGCMYESSNCNGPTSSCYNFYQVLVAR